MNVTRAGNVFTISFHGKFFAFNQPSLGALGMAGTNAMVLTTVQGAGATIVVDGAALELQGGITVGGESLLIEGRGPAQVSNVPEEWFNIGPNPINNAQTAGNQAVTGRVTGVVTDFTDSNVIYIATAGGGVWKTKDGGKSWLPLFDLQNGADEQQTVTVNGTGTFTLTFMDLAGASDTTVPLPTTASAQDLQTALNRLSTIGGNDGSVVVSRTGNVFTITFQGNLGAVNQPILTAGPTDPVTVATIADGLTADDPLYVGAIAMDPTDPRIIYIGTGETNNSIDSFYGSGIYRTIDSGKTWTLVSNNAIETITVLGVGGTFDFAFKGVVGNTLNVLDFPTAADIDAELEGLSTIGMGNVQVTSPVNDNNVQVVTSTGGAGTFTLTFDGATTAAINWNSTAAQVQTALAGLATVGGATARTPWTMP
ncbi:MAG: hypothetical protein L0Y71_02135 [Gemmataceae bacterium]|nr:hypothetical protein [Gemmataceae bacterium]